MYHSITFSRSLKGSNSSVKEINTWDDWHLIPSTRPYFAPPEVNTNYIEIPGSNGALDFTEVLTGFPTYKNRTGSIEFIVVNDYWPWEVAYSTISNYLHGQYFDRITLEDDPAHYYEGRLSVDSWTSYKQYSSITINYELHPYKKEVVSSEEDWLWDPFSFETGIIREYGHITVSGSNTITILGGQEPIVPTIIVHSGAPIGVKFGSFSATMSSNTSYFYPDIIIGEKDETITFTGNGVISISYRGGSL